MASLRLPRLCCPGRDDGTLLVLTSAVYHAVCGCSAVVGLLGLALCYPPTTRQRPHMGGRVLLASTMVTAGVLVNCVLWLSLPDFLSDQTDWPPHILCVIISTWIHFFCCVMFWAFFCYFLEIVRLLSANPPESERAAHRGRFVEENGRAPVQQSRPRFGRSLAWLCWGASSLMLLQGLLMMIPSENRCDSGQGLVAFHDAVWYVPLLLALLGSPVLLRRAIVRVPAVLKMQCGAYTSSERYKKHNLCRRLLGIYGVFMACWLGNVLCDFLLLLVEVWGTPPAPRQIQVAAMTLFVITGILNPVFCCVYSLAFYGWRNSSPSAPGEKQRGAAAPETPPETGEENAANATEKECLLQCEPSTSGKLSIPNILQLMDSSSSMEFRCSALEINAVRLLGTRETMAAPHTEAELKLRHSDV